MQRIQKTISEIAGEGAVPVMSPGESVAAAVHRMREHHRDGVVVMREEMLVGIFTGRDFLHRVAAEGRDPAATTLADVMTPRLESLRRDDSVAYAINLMAVRGFRNIPIVNDADRPVAMVSAHDIIDHLSEVLAELEPPNDETGPAARWVDLGGGG